MSFGFSVGDFIAVGSLIQNIVSSLRASSISDYCELILELHNLQLALNEIEHLECHPSQEPAVSAIKVAALVCQYPLDEFAGKLKKFDSLFTSNGANVSKTDRVKMWGKKLRWGFCMKEEVVRFRSYLVVHVGSLNMRLITQGLSSSSIGAERCQKSHESLNTIAEKSYAETVKARQDLQVTESLERSNNSVLTKLSSLITGDMVPQLQTLINLANNIWQSNLKIMSFFANSQTSSPSPDTRHSWFQEPIRFEDAMGRVIPIPSEDSWEMVESIIAARFVHVSGYEEISATNYELFNTLDSSQIVSRAENETIMPGLSITMAIVIFENLHAPFCPRPGCSSQRMIMNGSGGSTCCICRACIGLAHIDTMIKWYRHRLQAFLFGETISTAVKETSRNTRRRENERTLFKNFRTLSVPN